MEQDNPTKCEVLGNCIVVAFLEQVKLECKSTSSLISNPNPTWRIPFMSWVNSHNCFLRKNKLYNFNGSTANTSYIARKKMIQCNKNKAKSSM